jgi:6-phosphogluconolactonase/glucosamine-6-phosphate isomerase/deaminase
MNEGKMRWEIIHDIQPVTQYVTEVISAHLENNERVLWLVPGGSALIIAAAVGENLTKHDVKNLTVMLTDERYGPVDHADSNWKQLMDLGFSLPGAKLIPVLTKENNDAPPKGVVVVMDGPNIYETGRQFARQLEQQFGEADFKIGLFGMGADGHTAGILPHSPAVSSEQFVASYKAPHFERITMTPQAIAQLDEAILYAVGTEKRDALYNLHQDISLEKQPAQVLKKVPKLTIFTDQNVNKGEKP